MKKRSWQLLSVMLLGSALTLTACEGGKNAGKSDDNKEEQKQEEENPKDLCEGITCGDNSSCVKGDCQCNDGYSTYGEGKDCLNKIKVACMVPNRLVENGEFDQEAQVEIVFKDGAWSNPGECPVKCNEHYKRKASDNSCVSEDTDLCANITCGDHSSCNEGDCICDEGYSTYEDGEDCLNEVEAFCKVPNRDPIKNGQFDKFVKYTIKYDGTAWEEPGECPDKCWNDYEMKDGECVLKPFPKCVDVVCDDPNSHCNENGDCECNGNFGHYDGYSLCLDTVTDDCLTDIDIPENAHFIIEKVVLSHKDASFWNGPSCEWECDATYGLTAASLCAQSQEVTCSAAGMGQIAHGKILTGALVSQRWDDVEKAWVGSLKCPIECTDAGWVVDTDGASCVRDGNGEELLDCVSDNIPGSEAYLVKKATIWNGEAWVADKCDWQCDRLHNLNDSGDGCRELMDGECSDRSIFISEIFDGCSDNKSGTRVIELYNACDHNIDLSDWSLLIQSNENTSWTNDTYNVTSLKGKIIEAGKTLTIGGSISSLDFTADISAQPSFNGNDRIALFKNGKMIDIYGVDGVQAKEDDYWYYGDKKVIRAAGRLASKIFAPAENFASEWQIANLSCGSTADIASLGQHAFTEGCQPGTHAEGPNCVSNTKAVACELKLSPLPAGASVPVSVDIHWLGDRWEDVPYCEINCPNSKVYYEPDNICVASLPEEKYCNESNAPENSDITKVLLKVTYNAGDDTWTYEEANCAWNCKEGYDLTEIESVKYCLNEKQVDCRKPGAGSAEHYVDAKVAIKYVKNETTGIWEWEKAAICETECDEDYAYNTAANRCTKTMSVDCDTDSAYLPEHGQFIVAKVTVNVVAGTHEWEKAPACKFGCEEPFVLSGDGKTCITNDCNSDDIFISEVVDSDCKNGPKYLEIYNSCNKDVNLSGWSIRGMSARASSWSTFKMPDLSQFTIRANSTLVMSDKIGTFEGFAIDPDLKLSNGYAGNGRYGLFRGETLVDVYGAAEGDYWYYQDKRVIRNIKQKASATFVSEEDFEKVWTIDNAECSAAVFSSLDEHDYLGCQVGQHAEGENCVVDAAITLCKLLSDFTEVADSTTDIPLSAQVASEGNLVVQMCAIPYETDDINDAICKDASTDQDGNYVAHLAKLNRGDYSVFAKASVNNGRSYLYCALDDSTTDTELFLGAAELGLLSVFNTCSDFADDVAKMKAALESGENVEVDSDDGSVYFILPAARNSSVVSTAMVFDKTTDNAINEGEITASSGNLEYLYDTTFDGSTTLEYRLQLSLEGCSGADLLIYKALADGNTDSNTDVEEEDDIDLTGYSIEINVNGTNKKTVYSFTGKVKHGTYLVWVRNISTFDTFKSKFSNLPAQSDSIIYVNGAESLQINKSDDSTTIYKGSDVVDTYAISGSNIFTRQTDNSFKKTSSSDTSNAHLASGASSAITGYSAPIYIYEIGIGISSGSGNYIVYYIP